MNENECKTRLFTCDSTKNCVDRTPDDERPDGFDCVCNAGYKPNPNDPDAECIPIDYCTETDALYKDDAYLTCQADANASCDSDNVIRIDETFTTESGDSTTRILCTNSATCACNDGYHDLNTASDNQARACEDIITCKSGESDSFCDESNDDAFASCEEGLGTNPNICHCEEGYELDDDNKTCIDINECGDEAAGILATHDCNRFATCSNEPVGSYTCTCDPYYTSNGAGAGNGRGVDGCRDIDECILDTISTTGLRCITADLLAANTISVTVDGAAMQLNAYNAVKCNNIQDTCC